MSIASLMASLGRRGRRASSKGNVKPRRSRAAVTARSSPLTEPSGLNAMSRLIKSVIDYRRIVLALVALITLLLAAGASKLSIVIDPDETLPQDHPYLVATNLADKLFGNKFAVVIGVTPQTGDALQPSAIAAVKDITTKLAAADGVVPTSVVSLTARKVKDIAGSAEGLTVRQLTEGSSAAAPDRLRKALARNPVYQDLVISRDGRTAGIVAEFKKDPNGFKAIAARV